MLTRSTTDGCTTYTPVPCKTCESLPVLKDTCVPLCRCDEHCFLFGDCCPDAFVWPSSLNVSRNMKAVNDHVQCQSRYSNMLTIAVGDAYYMVSSCPSNWTNDTDFANSISFNCSSSTFSEFPPVSDPTTGITYRNEFCAICHRVDTSSTLTWIMRLRCNSNFESILSETAPENITVDFILSYCPRCAFDPPDNSSAAVMDSLRWCLPIISSCKPYSIVSNLYNETEYETITDACMSGDYNPLHEGPNIPSFIRYYKAIYKNMDCAKCNLASKSSLKCMYPSTSIGDTDSNSRCTRLDVRVPFGRSMSYNEALWMLKVVYLFNQESQ